MPLHPLATTHPLYTFCTRPPHSIGTPSLDNHMPTPPFIPTQPDGDDWRCRSTHYQHTLEPPPSTLFTPLGHPSHTLFTPSSHPIHTLLPLRTQDGDDWRCRSTLVGHTSTVWAVAFSPGARSPFTLHSLPIHTIHTPRPPKALPDAPYPIDTRPIHSPLHTPITPHSHRRTHPIHTPFTGHAQCAQASG